MRHEPSVFAGSHSGYALLAALEGKIAVTPDVVKRSHLGMRLAIACFDSGRITPSAQELAKRTGSSLEHLTHLQTATRTPVSLNAVLDDDSDFKLTEAMPDNNTNILRDNNERQEALNYLMDNLRPRERKVLDLRFGLTGAGAPGPSSTGTGSSSPAMATSSARLMMLLKP